VFVMPDEPLVAAPGGLGAVSSWVEELFGWTPGSGLWTSLDDTLRLALAQGWILTVDGGRDDELAEPLSHRYPQSDRFDEMLGDLIDHWQQVYVVLEDGAGVLDQVNLVSVDMELVVLTGPERLGSFSAGASEGFGCDITGRRRRPAAATAGVQGRGHLLC
jgi:hypothetical protein